jgi:uncharacterized protein (DUF983 family)
MEKNSTADVNAAKSMGMLKSSVLLRCPRCHQGSLYTNPKAYTWTKIGEMNKTCPHCHTNFNNEVGFYFGAAYVSYALTVALWVSVLVALIVFDALGWIEFGFLTHPLQLLTVGCVATAILFPYIFRLSRSIWAHFFIK